MNIPSAASSRRGTIEAQRMEMVNLINEAVNKGHFQLWVQEVHPVVLDEVKVQGYEVESIPERCEGSCLIKW